MIYASKKIWKLLLGNLGSVVHPEKSVIVPSQESLKINSVTMTVRLTTEKKRKIFDLYRGVLLKEPFVIRLVSKLLGKFISSFQAIKYRQLRYRDLERLKIKALKINENNFDKKTSTDTHGKQDIIWWKKYSRVIQYYKN